MHTQLFLAFTDLSWHSRGSGACRSWIIFLAWPGGKPSPAVLPVLLFCMGFFASGFILVWACAKEVNPIELSGCAMGLGGLIFTTVLGLFLKEPKK